jgi:hypothetical protein
MRSCLVIAGEYRTFDQTYESIAEFAKINELDVYCHLWTDNELEFESVKDKLNPKFIISDSPASYKDSFLDIERRIKENNPKGPNGDKVWQNASMNFSRKKAFESVPKDTYSTVVFARYDLKIVTPFNFSQVTTGVVTAFAESWGLISDVFAIMPFDQANHFFLYDEFERLHSTPFEEEFIDYLRNDFKYGENNIRIHRDERYCPHMILIRNFVLNKIPWRTADFPVRLQR